MVLALSLVSGFPHRETIVAMAFGVVILSILIQGLTAGPLLRLLRLARRGTKRMAYERARGALLSARAALLALEALPPDGSATPESLAALREQYAEQIRRGEQEVGALLVQTAELREDEEIALHRHLLVVEKEAASDLYRQGVIGSEALAALLSEINTRLLSLEERHRGAKRKESAH